MADRTERRFRRALRELTRGDADPTGERRYPPGDSVVTGEVVEMSESRSVLSTIARAFTLPSHTRDSSTLAASARAINRSAFGGAEGAMFGAQAKSLKDTHDFLEAMADRTWVYACCTRKAKSMKQGTMLVEPSGVDDPKPLDKHGILDLFKNPSPNVTGGLFMEQMQLDLDLTGNFYAEVVYGTGNTGVPLQMYRMRPDKIKIAINLSTGEVDSYYFVPGAIENAIRLEPWQVWHRRYANPLDEWRGLSPLSAARDSIVFEYQAKAQGIAFFANGLRMSGLISGPENVDPDDLKLIKRIVEGRHQGQSNAHRLMVLPGQWKYEDLSATPRDADWIEGLAMTRREVCAIYRVAPPLAGDFSEGTTFSNLEEARDEFWQGTMAEHFANLDEDINHSLLPRFGAAALKLEVRHDLSDVPAMQDDKDKAYTRVLAAWNGGMITLNEAREQVDGDLEPFDNGDIRRCALTVSEIPADEPPPDPEPPVDPNAPVKPPDTGGKDGSGGDAKPAPKKDTPQDGKQDQGVVRPVATHDEPGSFTVQTGTGTVTLVRGSSVAAKAAAYAKLRAASCAPVIREGTKMVAKFVAAQEDEFMAYVAREGGLPLAATTGEALSKRALDPHSLPHLISHYDWVKPEAEFGERVARGVHLLASKPAWDNSQQVGLGVSYNLNDPSLVNTLNNLNAQYNGQDQGVFAGIRDDLIDETAKGLDLGASLQQIIDGGKIKPHGDPEAEPVELKGLRGVYAPWRKSGDRWKAERFARTETGKAYNMSSIDSYRAAGITQVNVFDGEYDPPCAEANGQVWDTDFAYENPLEHPNCVRAFGPHDPNE